jgi:hypothetical protein
MWRVCESHRADPAVEGELDVDATADSAAIGDSPEAQTGHRDRQVEVLDRPRLRRSTRTERIAPLADFPHRGVPLSGKEHLG